MCVCVYVVRVCVCVCVYVVRVCVCVHSEGVCVCVFRRRGGRLLCDISSVSVMTILFLPCTTCSLPCNYPRSKQRKLILCKKHTSLPPPPLPSSPSLPPFSFSLPPSLPLSSCLFRVLDSFGTEPTFNFKGWKPAPPTGRKSDDGRIWGNWELNPRQFMTMYRESHLPSLVSACHGGVPSRMGYTPRYINNLYYGRAHWLFTIALKALGQYNYKRHPVTKFEHGSHGASKRNFNHMTVY